MWPGMLAETRELLRRFSGREPGFQSLGYPEAVACIRGELDNNEGLRRLVSSTCAYARRQRTWFRHQLAATSIAGGEFSEMVSAALRRCDSYAPAA
jgi:tRNA dimethylallyltransferase